jgi:NAD(P)H-quinone oxidoreductase subunit 4L
MNLVNLLLVAAALFCIGVYGFLTSQNIVRILMCLEILLNAINLNLVSFSTFLDSQELKGQVFAIFIITLAAAESVIALAILLILYRNKESIAMNDFNLLKW